MGLGLGGDGGVGCVRGLEGWVGTTELANPVRARPPAWNGCGKQGGTPKLVEN